MEKKNNNEIVLTLPESWNDITLEQYVKLVKLIDKYDINNPTEAILMRLEQLNILNDTWTLDQLKKLTIPQLTTYFKGIEFINNDPVLENCKEIVIEDKKYIFNDFKHLTLEQWIDAEKFSELELAHRLIAIFYINPKEYDDLELDKVSEWLLKAPVTKYFWSVSFFLFIHRASELAILRYSEKIETGKKKMEKVIRIGKKVEETKKRILKRFGFK